MRGGGRTIAGLNAQANREKMVKILRADDGDWRTYQSADRIKELEAKLAKAVEALQTLKDWPEYRLLSSQEYACNTLAELEGEEDE
jgi:hypothetical protein